MTLTVNKLFIWIAIILIVIIIAGLTVERIWHDTSRNKALATVTAERDGYKNAPADTIVIRDSIVYRDTTIYKPYPVKVLVHDTTIKVIKENWYSEAYKKDGIRFNYQAHTMGELLDLKFTDFVWPKEIITITRQVDTCATKPAAYKPMLLHWGVYTEVVTDNFTTFPGVGLGGQIILNDRLTIGLGGLYLDGFKGSLRIGVLLR